MLRLNKEMMACKNSNNNVSNQFPEVRKPILILKGENDKGDVIEKEIDIESLIYEIIGAKVMIDSDIARLYQVDTKRINETVKNNPNRFPMRCS